MLLCVLCCCVRASLVARRGEQAAAPAHRGGPWRCGVCGENNNHPPACNKKTSEPHAYIGRGTGRCEGMRGEPKKGDGRVVHFGLLGVVGGGWVGGGGGGGGVVGGWSGFGSRGGAGTGGWVVCLRRRARWGGVVISAWPRSPKQVGGWVVLGVALQTPTTHHSKNRYAGVMTVLCVD